MARPEKITASNANPIIKPSDVSLQNSPSFLDGVRCDREREMVAECDIDSSIQTLSSQMETLIHDLELSYIQVDDMIEDSNQRRMKIRQEIGNCERRIRQQKEQLLKT